MSVTRLFLIVSCIAAVASSLSTQPLAAQTADYFRPLVVPPTSVGTCLPTDTSHAAAHGPLTNIHLVMVSPPPGSRREMVVAVDRTGRTVRYSELINGFISLRASTEDALVASVDTLGRVAGWHLHITGRIPDSVSFGTSAASISRAVKEHSIRTTSRDTLNASAKRQVLQLAKWLRSRCPA